jgi:hypothetical protein
MGITAVSYRVGVKRKFLPFYKKYWVVGHVNETVGDKVRLVLRCNDGSLVCVPDVGSRQIKLYPERESALAMQKKLKAPPEEPTDVLPSGE